MKGENRFLFFSLFWFHCLIGNRTRGLIYLARHINNMQDFLLFARVVEHIFFKGRWIDSVLIWQEMSRVNKFSKKVRWAKFKGELAFFDWIRWAFRSISLLPMLVVVYFNMAEKLVCHLPLVLSVFLMRYFSCQAINHSMRM